MEKHGFDGDGFGYLRNPVWWAGITTSERRIKHFGKAAGLTGISGVGRDIQLRRVCVCASHSGYATRRTFSAHRRGPWVILPGRTARVTGQDWLRDMSDRIRHHRSACPAG
jgi:hypothetical protein